MKLKPVKEGERVHLRDRDAAAPDGVPHKDELERRQAGLGRQLADLQAALYAESKRALLVVFQARDAGGKDGAIKRVFGPLNPQGSYVASFRAPTEDELAHDFLWRVHAVVPRKGYIGIFNRSHYEDVLVPRVEGLVPPKVWKKRYAQINDFERMLARNGTVILKFFLHVSRDEQKQRFLERLDDPAKNWKFREGDIAAREKWDEYNQAYRAMIRRCSTRWAPWFVVPSDDKRVRDYLVSRTVVRALRRMDPRFPAASTDVLSWRDRIA
ncbi:MAG TPA: PPK2 family polyphosphate kinase [Longimicrobiaceae bacterium]|nr:PPK2 family polyphosphate kinase [Longimicrobiaceae bacterium]